MSGISYTPPGGAGIMTTFSGSFTNAEILASGTGPLFPGIVTQIYFNILANPSWPLNTPEIFFVLDTAVSNQIGVPIPSFVGDPFNVNWMPVDITGTPFYYTQSFSSSFLRVNSGGPGLVGVTINFTALCWQP